MDLSTVVNYDETFPVEIKHRITGEPTGLVMNVASFESAEADKAERAVANDRMRRQFLAQQSGAKPDDIDFAGAEYDAKVEKAIVSVRSWDWADGLKWQGEAPPKWSPQAVRDVLTHPNSRWILAQVINAGSRIENFTGPSATSA